jgi:hypothetical protein
MRFSILKSEGIVTVLRDVVVHTTETGEFVVIDREPRAPNELLTIETMLNGELAMIPVTVIASRPVIQQGAVLHELLLRS